MRNERLSSQALSALCLELALLLHAGVGTGDGLSLMAQEEAEPSTKALLADMAGRVDEGSTLAAACRATGRFPDYVCGLVEVGERSGRAEEALRALARYYEDRVRMDRRLRSALLYPAVLLLTMLTVIVVLLVKVLPLFNEIYADLGGRLTGVAGGLLALGRMLDRAMPLLCALLGAAGVVLILFAVSLPFRDKALSLWRSRWGDRGVSRKLSTARFAQALSMGLTSGLPLEEALSLSAALLDKVPAAKARCQTCLTLLEEGIPFAQAVRRSGVLPSAQCRLLDLGLRGGSGDETMERIARQLSEDSEAALAEKVGQVEPTLVVMTSVLVGLILLSVMLPLMHIMAAIG